MSGYRPLHKLGLPHGAVPPADQEMRMRCLELARKRVGGRPTDELINTARVYFLFVTGQMLPQLEMPAPNSGASHE